GATRQARAMREAAFVLCLTATAHAQPGTWQPLLSDGKAHVAALFADGAQLVAVGVGTWVSGDAGATWSHRATGSLGAVCGRGPHDLFAIGEGHVLRST